MSDNLFNISFSLFLLGIFKIQIGNNTVTILIMILLKRPEYMGPQLCQFLFNNMDFIYQKAVSEVISI